MRVLVVGGAGYIGGITANALLDAGANVTVFDNLSTGHREAVPEGAEFVQGELGDRDSLDRALRGQAVDAVMYFAALIQAGESMERPGLYFANNISNVIALINSMGEHGVNKFVFSSSAAVYGEPKSVPIDESSPTYPTNP
ncbi:MAG: UDP-galactose 4-epimerase, partial [Dehalococcoidia bacterium]|nr:UDP-galactose 4-epimerase [Dehalococcoidia bacterium]